MTTNYLKEQSEIILKKLELKEQLLDKLIDKVTHTYEKNSTSLIAKKTLENLSSNLNNYDQFNIYDKTIVKSNLIQQGILNDELNYVFHENEQLKITIFNYQQALNKLMDKYHEHINELIKNDSNIDLKKVHSFYLKEISVREEIIESIKNKFYNLATYNQQLIEQTTIKNKYLTEENAYLRYILGLNNNNDDCFQNENISLQEFKNIMLERKLKMECRRKDKSISSVDLPIDNKHDENDAYNAIINDLIDNSVDAEDFKK